MNKIFEEAVRRIEPTIPDAEVHAEMRRIESEIKDRLPIGVTFSGVRNSLAAVRAADEEKQRNAARDAAIDGEPEIETLRRKLDEATSRQDHVKAKGRAVLSGLSDVIGDLGADIARLEAAAEACAIEEALAGELEFHGAVAKLKAIEPLRHRLAAATMARKKLGVNDDMMLRRASSDVSVATAALNDATQRRRRESPDAPA